MRKANASRRFPLTLFPISVIAAVFIAVVAPRSTRETISAQTRPAVQSPDPFEIRLASRRFTPEEARPEWSKLFAKSKSEKLHAIVQLRETPTPQTTTALASAGISLGQPLSGRAYLATIKRGVKASAEVLNQLRWAGAFSSEDKLSPAIQRLEPSAFALRNAGRVELVVTVFPDADFAAATKKAQALSATILGEARLLSTFAVSLPLHRERELASDDGIQYLEPLPAPGKSESDRARTHVHADVGAIPAGRSTGQGVIAAIFDSSHALITHADFGTRVVQGDAPDNYDPEGHPTMTAGMIAGDGTISIGQGALMNKQWRGLAPAAQVRSYSFLSSGGDSVTDYLGDVTNAVQHGVVVLNNSWGDSGCMPVPYGSYEGRAPVLDGVITGSLGRPVTIVFSAGNERAGYPGPNNTSLTDCIANTTAPFANYATLNRPKSAKNVIVVGAIDSANNAMTDYSSWGPTRDGRIKPDVVASGQHNGTMTSGVSHIDNAFGSPTGSANQQGYRIAYYAPNSTFADGWFDQTSCAASIVSGGIALMIDDWRRHFRAGDPLPSTVRALLVNNAFDLNDAATTWYKPGPDYASGYGLVQINETLQSIERVDFYESSVANQATVSCPVTIPAGTPQFKVTLAWDDPAAMARTDASPVLINDLDLVVTDPTGTRQYPWTLDHLNPQAAAVRTQEDHLNNLEQVLVANPTPGAWTVVIRGTAVPQGPQKFSLVSANGLGCPRIPSPPTNLNVVVQ